MARKGSVQVNEKRRRLSDAQKNRRDALNKIVHDKLVSADERFQAALKLAAMPRIATRTRVRNRCVLSGRPRGYYRKLGLSRIALRELASTGSIPGMTKSSW